MDKNTIGVGDLLKLRVIKDFQTIQTLNDDIIVILGKIEALDYRKGQLLNELSAIKDKLANLEQRIAKEVTRER